MIEVLEYSQADSLVWDKFVEASNNGTIFHKLSFLSYHPKGKFIRKNLVFKKRGQVIALLPGAVRNKEFYSPAGASYGSFVVGNIVLAEYEEIIDAFLKYLKRKKINKITLTPPPIFYLKKQNELERFLLEYKGFKAKHHLVTNALQLNTLKNKETILNSFTSMHRRAVCKSLKNDLLIRTDKNYKEFYEILLDNKKKFNSLPTHTLDELLVLQKNQPKDVKLLMAYTSQHDPIAGILIFKCNENTALAFYISHYYSYQNLRAINRLFYELILWSKRQSISWLDLGVSMDTSSKNPMEPSRSLIFFKEGIGTRGFLRTTYTYNFSKK